MRKFQLFTIRHLNTVQLLQVITTNTFDEPSKKTIKSNLSDLLHIFFSITTSKSPQHFSLLKQKNVFLTKTTQLLSKIRQVTLTGTTYLKERNYLRDKFAKINPRKKSTGSKFVKLNPRKKKFFSFFRISKTYVFTLGPLSVNDRHVKNISQVIKQQLYCYLYLKVVTT